MHQKLNPYLATLLVTIIASGVAHWLVWKIYEIEEGQVFFPTTVRRQVFRATGDTPDTSTWKTYRNEEYGFEIKYPENWFTGEIDSVLLFAKVGSDNLHGELGIQIHNVVLDKDIADTDQLENFAKKRFGFDLIRIFNLKQNSIEVEATTLQRRYFLLYNRATDQIVEFSGGPENFYSAPLFIRILSTFKFIK